jgi:hypothetical protein
MLVVAIAARDAEATLHCLRLIAENAEDRDALGTMFRLCEFLWDSDPDGLEHLERC